MTTFPLHAPLPRTALPVGRAAAGRSLLGYLLVPRPKDLVKAVVLPIAFALGVAADGGTSTGELLRAALVWFALELLVYQARYQWNDVRGFTADQAHPEAAARGRLPGPVEKGPQHIAASLGVLALRLVLTGVLALLVPDLAGLLLCTTAGVFGVAVVYERLRTAATGRTASVPVPLRPALLALWVAVGAGYAVRGLTGLALAVQLGDRPGLLVTAAVAMWALGVVFVTCRWALETMCFGEVRDGRMVWQVRPDQAREHTLGLVRWLPQDASAAGTEPCGWRALQGRTALHAPWHLALLTATAAAALAGVLFAGEASATTGAVSVLAGAALAAAVALSPGRRRVVAVVGTALLLAGQVALGTDRPLVAVLPVGVVLVLYGCFTRQCADEVGRPLHRLQLLRHG